MTDYYADFDNTAGTNSGTQANPWKSMADIIAGTNSSAPVAGETVYCKGTDSISSMISWTLSGSAAAGYIKLIGVDASWDNVGGSTRAVIDAQTNNIDALSIESNFLWLENFEVKNAGSSGTNYDGIIFASGAFRYYINMTNVYSHNNYGSGFNGNGGYCCYSFFLQCRASNNAGKGFEDLKTANILACRADNNTGYGFDITQEAVVRDCIAHDNDLGFYFYNSNSFNAGGNVAHGNTNDGFKYYSPFVLPYCRSTSNGTGVDYIGSNRMVLFYYYGDNTTETSGYYDDILNTGVSTVTLNGTDTDEGFTDPSSDDYTLASGATYRRVAVSIP